MAPPSHCVTVSLPAWQVTVLEARNRVGGRMFSRTSTLSDGTVLRAEMGAQWMRVSDGNPIVRLARRMGLKTKRLTRKQQHFTAAGKVRALRCSAAGLLKDSATAVHRICLGGITSGLSAWAAQCMLHRLRIA